MVWSGPFCSLEVKTGRGRAQRGNTTRAQKGLTKLVHSWSERGGGVEEGRHVRVVVLAAVAPLERVAAVPVVHATAVGPSVTPILAHMQVAQRLERTERARALRRPLAKRAFGRTAPAWRRLSERAPVHDRASDADDALVIGRAAWPGAIAQLARLLVNAAQAVRERRVKKGVSWLVHHEVLGGQHAANRRVWTGLTAALQPHVGGCADQLLVPSVQRCQEPEESAPGGQGRELWHY